MKRSDRLVWTRLDQPHLMSNTYLTPLPVTPKRHYWEGVPTHVSRWWNHYEHSYVVALSDAEGHQIGSSEYVGTREDAEYVARDMILDACTDPNRPPRFGPHPR